MHAASISSHARLSHEPIRNEKAEKSHEINERKGIKANESDHEKKAKGHKRPGVLRLLESGHFKGVAELRHRIRFHEELSERAKEEAAEVLADGADELVNSVNEGVEALASSLAALNDVDEATEGDAREGDDDASEIDHAGEGQGIGSLLEGFESAVEEAVTVDEGEPVDLEAVAANLNGAFDALVASLRERYAEPVIEPVGDEAVATDATIIIDPAIEPELGIDQTAITSPDLTEIVDDSIAIEEMSSPPPESASPPDSASLLEDAIDSLRSSFEATLQAMLAEAEESLQLPDPRPTHGRGGAFARFLAIYDSLRGVDAPTIDEAA